MKDLFALINFPLLPLIVSEIKSHFGSKYILSASLDFATLLSNKDREKSWQSTGSSILIALFCSHDLFLETFKKFKFN